MTRRDAAAQLRLEIGKVETGAWVEPSKQRLEYELERLMREAPFLLIGEGTSEIQKTIISRGLLKEYALKR
jgi:hypothetical protein